MDTLVPILYGEYGKYVNSHRAFPFILDGAKLVEKRLLYTLYEIAKTKTKSAKVVGHCIGNYHPHGDCLDADTKIPLLDGSIHTIKWLFENKRNDKFWVYSCDSVTGKIVPGLAHSPRIGHTTNVKYIITLDNGESVICTSNHPFMLKDCTFTPAEKLKVGNSLMPFHLKDVNGYNYNHIVVNIERVEIESPIDFYDITVDKYHNFAIDQGIFVHNSSAYDSLVGLVKNGFAIGQGNWGIDVGISDCPAAAQRYTEVQASKDILNMAFEYIKSVPYHEDEMDSEPIFLPTQLPICFLPKSTYCQGMGVGYRTLIPSYKKQDLIKRLEWILDGKKGVGPIIKPLSTCNIISANSELVNLLTTGRAKIEFQGKFKQDDKKSIIIESIPPSKSFETILKKFKKEMEVDNSLGITDESKTTTKVRFTILKPRMLKMSSLLKKLKTCLIGSLTFECHVCNINGKVVLLSVDDMLLNVYKVYKKVVESVLKQQSNDIQNEINELNLIGKIKPLLSNELRTNPDDLDIVLTNISTSLSISKEVLVGIFNKYSISRLFKIKTDTNLLIKQKANVDSTIVNVVSYIWKEKYLK